MFAQSRTEHYNLARDLVKKYRLDIFTVSELWLDYSISDLEVEFPGFTLHRPEEAFAEEVFAL